MPQAVAQLDIPRDILDSARLTLADLRTEIAIHLYTQRRLAAGKARELAGLSLWEFRQLLGARRIPVHLDIEDLEQDAETLGELRGV